MKNVFIKSIILDKLKKCQFDRFYNFKSQWVFSKMQKTFTTNFKYIFFFESKHYKNLKNHSYKKNFWNFMKQQIKQHKQDFNFWTTIDRQEFNEHQMLDCQWMFKYKTNKHGELLKCKARIIVCDNQQHWPELFIWVITLVIAVLQILLTLFARFNLEILQLDVINVFIHVFLNEIVFMRMFFEYEKQKKILQLNKTFYDFKQSPLLWQRKFMDVLRKLGFIEIFQKPCIVVCHKIIIFFFVNDCVIVFFENKRDEMMIIMNKLIKKFIINIIDEFKWFLKMHIIKNHSIKCLWLFQKTYIEKICKNLMKSSINHSSFTFMNTAELLSAKNDKEISNKSKILYQWKVESLLFAVIFMKSDIAFAVSKLFQFNVHFNKKYHTTMKRVLQYFYHTRNICIRYENNKIINKKQYLISFMCANDASFANNIINWKNS